MRRRKRWWQDHDGLPSWMVLIAWCALWFAICVGRDFLSVAACITQAEGVSFGTGTELAACDQMILRARTRGAWPAYAEVWGEARGVLPSLPDWRVTGLPDAPQGM